MFPNRLLSKTILSPPKPLQLLLLLVLLLITPMSLAEPSTTQTSGPLVLELFTSQGCSSCPPADRLLRELSESGIDVIPLSFHVDYWNYIGWTDPFSSAKWSERQRLYARHLEYGRVYTPQLVIDGRASCVGSDADTVRELIAEARLQPRHGRVGLDVEPSGDGKVLTLRANGEVLSGKRALTLYVAVFETELETPIKSGENARRTLRNDYVVRHFESLGKVKPGTKIDANLEIVLDPGWRGENVGVVAFLQDTGNLEIHGANIWSGPVS